MLVKCTPISSLNERELQELKFALYGINIEGRTTPFSYNGKTFLIQELQSLKTSSSQKQILLEKL